MPDPIKIGETHVVCPTLGNSGKVQAKPDATEAVKRLVEAARGVSGGSHLGQRALGKALVELDDALAPFMEQGKE